MVQPHECFEFPSEFCNPATFLLLWFYVILWFKCTYHDYNHVNNMNYLNSNTLKLGFVTLTWKQGHSSFMMIFLVVLQAFIQALLLMSVFEQRLSFWMFYFMKNDSKIIVKCRWGSGGDISSVVGWWWSPDGGSGGKAPEKFWLFNIWRASK